jgi:hypothetical protein
MLRFSLLLALTSLLALPAAAHAGFDWGGDCSSGGGTFTEFVPQYQTLEVGVIPAGKRFVEISLESDQDVDIQLIDVATGTEIIAWPSGLLSGATEDCTTWEGVTYCWSGYNGGQTSGTFGNEWIRINGDSNRDVQLKVYGYQAGDSDVTYSFDAVPTCYEIGDGGFNQYVPLNDVVVVGEIPANMVNVSIELQAGQGRDVDVQLIDGFDGTEIVAWPSGIMNGPDAQSTLYRGMEILWSGYNGIDGNWGHESIEIVGAVTRPLIMKAFGYEAGDADVTYSWGEGAGATCLGIATLSCEPGLWCKGVQTGVSDPAGSCHTELWCESDASAPADCSNVIHPAVPGFFGCEEYSCGWNACGAVNDPSFIYTSNDTDQCKVIRFVCPADQEYFLNQCGCGCRAL